MLLRFTRSLSTSLSLGAKTGSELLFWLPEKSLYRFPVGQTMPTTLLAQDIVVKNDHPNQLYFRFDHNIEMLLHAARSKILYEGSSFGAKSCLKIADNLIDHHPTEYTQSLLKADSKVVQSFILHRDKKYEQSLAIMQEGVAIKQDILGTLSFAPDLRRVHAEMGLLLLLMGKLDEAQEVYDFVCKDHQWEPFILNSAFINVLKGKPDQALEQYAECEQSERDLIAEIATHNIGVILPICQRCESRGMKGFGHS